MALAFRKLSAGVAAAALLVFSAPVEAADPAAIKKDLDQIVSAIRRAAGPGPGLQIDGQATVREQGGEVIATFPTLTSKSPEGGVVLRPITLRVKDIDADQQQILIQLPPRIEATGPDGKPMFALAIGSQNLTGVWRKSIQNFESLQMTLDRVTLQDPAQKSLVEIQRISATGGLKEGAPGLWSGAIKFAVDGTKVSGPDGTAVSVGSTFYEYTLKDARLVEFARLTDAAGVSFSNPQLLLSGGGISLQQWQQVVDLLAQVPALIGGMSILYGVNDITVAHPMMGPQPMFRAESLAFGFGVANDGAGGASLSVGIDLQRMLGPTELPIEVPAAAVPHSFDLRIEIDQLPTGAVWDAFFGTLRQQLARAPQARPGQRPPPAEQMLEAAAGAAFGMSLPTAMESFAKARPQLHIRSLSLAFPDARVDGIGTVRFAPEAPQMASGSFDVKLAGLDDVIEKLGRAPKNDEEATAVVALTFLRGLGKPTPGPGGKPIYVIQVQVGEDGKVMANGIDAMKVIELLDKSR
ncbi:hypothetical protein STVA_43860 [Allostella vacuolata]|nr:hypothetical protein STVA_43860 [Stella vacuolata]